MSIEKLLFVNQPVRVHVLGHIETKGGKRETWCSVCALHTSIVTYSSYLGEGFAISACIASKEDHGYIVSTGIPNASFSCL